MIQALNLFVERIPVRRYNLGIQAAAGFALLIITVCVENGIQRSYSSSADGTRFWMLAIELIAAVISCCTCLFLPRRPSVSHGGQTVDKQYTVSALNRWTWTWASEYLALARLKNRLVLSDIPVLNFGVRADYVVSRMASRKPRDRLWKTLIFTHRLELVIQSMISIMQGIIQFAPQFAMYKLLELLEDRAKDNSIAKIAWAYVIGLGLSISLAGWMEAWIHWIVLARLGLLIRTELSALIFSKTMRRKDVKGSQKNKTTVDAVTSGINETISRTSTADTRPFSDLNTAENDETDLSGEGITGRSSGQPVEQSTTSPVKEPYGQPISQFDTELEDVQQLRQSIINLIAVDTKRIADFATYHFVFAQMVARLGASVTFLLLLIGWKSLFAGLAVSALVTPINIYASKKFSKSQVDLMSARDRKMVVITEALQGIRQIKFSALESQWQDKIAEKRKAELAEQWGVFFWDIVLISIWILGPVMLSAVSLAVYAVIYGDLTPSIAFTTITIFGQIESVLAVIPELVAEALEAWVSARRIGEYLEAGEKENYIIPGADICYENASITWPADSEGDRFDQFILNNVNISFPNKELSVISGKTGAGKSLLLASVLGEAELLAGTIKVPKSAEQRHDHKANKSNWIIDSAIAFVAQIPWIENASIKDNILFDLPYDEYRYKKTLESCALVKDLEILPDGELTDIGAQGINLSGGQRWRISFARALYSRAGILILDDIFSAVDAHVGRQLFEDALTGELGQGRTRLLVTHHVGLCLPKTRYTVLLDEGTVKHAGFIEDLQRTGILDEILKQGEEVQTRKDQEEEELLRLQEVNENTLGRIHSRATETSVNIDDGGENTSTKAQPKKFNEEEKREVGSIKLGIYQEYLSTSGGWWAWIPILLAFLIYQGVILGRVCNSLTFLPHEKSITFPFPISLFKFFCAVRVITIMPVYMAF